MPPPPTWHPGVGGRRPGGDSSAPDRGISRLGSGSLSSSGAVRSRSGYGGRSFLAPLGLTEDNRSSTFDLVDLDRHNSFQAVLHLIQEFHSLEEPASVALNQCKTSLAPVYGLQSESSLVLH